MGSSPMCGEAIIDAARPKVHVILRTERQLFPKAHVILRAVAGSTPATTAALTPVPNAQAGVDSATALRYA
jgi:hypothetical protein